MQKIVVKGIIAAKAPLEELSKVPRVTSRRRMLSRLRAKHGIEDAVGQIEVKDHWPILVIEDELIDFFEFSRLCKELEHSLVGQNQVKDELPHASKE